MNKESVSQGHKLTEPQTQLLHPAQPQPGFSKERPLLPPTTADQSLLSVAQITMHSTHQADSRHCLQPNPPVAPGDNNDATAWGTHTRQLPNKPLLVCNSTSTAPTSSASVR